MYKIQAYKGNEIENIETEEKAKQLMLEEIEKWCAKEDVSIKDIYVRDDNLFAEYDESEEEYHCWMVVEVPEFVNKFEEILWNIKRKCDMVDAGMSDYACRLEDTCTVRNPLDEIRVLIDELEEELSKNA